MDFNLEDIISHISQTLGRYDKKEIKASQAAAVLIQDFEKIAKYFNDHFDDLSDKERTYIIITIYSINETIIKMFSEINQYMDEKTGGFLSGRKDILTFDFSWDKED